MKASKLLILLLLLFSLLKVTSDVQALTLPLIGKVEIGSDAAQDENNLTLDVIFGYRSSPQYYNVNLDTIDISALIVNNGGNEASGQFEIKFYRFIELWNTKTNTISYEDRTAYVNGQPKDENMTFTEEQLIDIVHSAERCDSANPQDSIYQPPCYHDLNPDDNNNPYGGFVLDSKPIHVIISDPLTVQPGEATTYVGSWIPTECGYFQVIVQPFGYTQEEGEEDIQSREAYIRVKGCDDGEIIEPTPGEVLATNNEDGLPATSVGFLALVVPAAGLILGGALIHTGTRKL